MPLSCLICKKRKVKCDKIKPACSGCHKNGVAHLCKYMEPDWTRENELDERYNEGVSSNIEVPKFLKDDSNRILSHQRDEIERLKRTLEIQQQLVGKKRKKDEKIKVLERLAPGFHDRNEKVEVSNVSFYVLRHRDSNWEHLNDMLSLLSSTNTIKLDFQLVSLWGQISHLRQLYLTYIRNQGPHNGPEKGQRRVFDKNFGQKKINEVDFTYAKSQKPTYVEGRCPVLHCDLNFVRGIDHGSIKSERCVSQEPRETLAMKETSTPSEQEKVGEPGKRMLIAIQKIWNAAITFSNKKMNYEQICFLINFYFSTNNELGGPELFCLFKDEIFNLIKKDGNRVYLNCLGVRANTDSEQYLKLGFEGLYICMIALINEVSLIQLGNNIMTKKGDQVSEDFGILFPEIYEVSDCERIRYSIFHLVRDFILMLSMGKDNSESSLFQKSLPFISCLLNFVIFKLETTDFYIWKDFRQLISHVFELTINPFFGMSKNPEIFTFNGQDTSIKIRALRLHFCYMWSNVMRLFNIIVIHYCPVNTKENVLNEYKDKFYGLVEETYSNGYHLNFISHYDKYALTEMKQGLEDQFLVARICGALNNGVYFGSQAYLTVDKLDNMMVDCDKWLNNNSLDRVINSKYLETYCSISYLRVHMGFIKFLHTEEGKDEDTQCYALLDLLSIFSKYTLFLKALLKIDPRNNNYFSILNIAVESLSRLVHIGLALYLRLTCLPKYSSYQLSQNIMGTIRKHMALFSNFSGVEKEVSSNPADFLADIISPTLESQLELSGVNSKLLRLSRLWNFCSTLIRKVGRRAGENVKLHLPEQDLEADHELGSRHCPLTHNMSREAWSILHPHMLTFQYKKPECPIFQSTTPKIHSSDMSSSKKMQESIGEQGHASKKKYPFNKIASHKEDDMLSDFDVEHFNRSYEDSKNTHFNATLESSLNERPKETIPSKYENSFECSERGNELDELNISRVTGDPATSDLADVDLDFLQTEPMIDEFDFEIFCVDAANFK